MHALQTSGRARSSSNGNSLYTPTFDASDKEEEEVESSDPDLSDYYSDSGYPTLPRPRLVLWTSRRNYSPPRSDDGQRKAGTPPPVLGQKLADSSRVRSRHRKLPASSPTTSRETSSSSKGKAFSKLRSLRNNRILPASSPENERPPSTLVTTCISANGKSATQTVANSAGHPKQLRSVSLPTGDSTMAQAKQKKSKKPNRALSFSFGSGDKKKRARSLFGSIGRGRGEIVTDEQAAAAPQSPVLIGRRLRGTKTIYEEDRGSLSSVEEEEERMNSLNYLHGNRFGSCRELTSAGLSAMTDSGIDAQPQLRPLSKKRHKRPSLPNFAKHFPGSHSSSGRASPQEERRDRTRTDSVSSQVSDTTPPGSATSSPTPSRQRVRIRKLSDPGSAPSTPEAGNSPLTERRAAREDGGVVRGSRPLRKGFTFSVGVGNLSPDWKEMRHHVVRFLLETEQSYVQSLRTIIKVYYEPLKRPQAFGLIDSSLVEDIFYQIPEICSLHERFLLQISQRTDHWHPLQKIGDVFVNTFSKCHLMNIYTKFIHNFMRAKAAIEIAKQARPVFAKFLEVCP